MITTGQQLIDDIKYAWSYDFTVSEIAEYFDVTLAEVCNIIFTQTLIYKVVHVKN